MEVEDVAPNKNEIMEIEDVASNENKMIEVEDNRHEIEEISDEVLGVQLCFRRFSVDSCSGRWWSK